MGRSGCRSAVTDILERVFRDRAKSGFAGPYAQRMRLALVAIAATLLAGGCGRYEGVPEPGFESTLDIQWDEEPLDRAADSHPAERMLRVTVRDVDQADFYDESCRLQGPQGASRDWYKRYGAKLLIVAKEAESGSNSRLLDLPLQAVSRSDGCEAPSVLVTLPFAEEFTAAVIDPMCCGLLNPERPYYPATFDVPWIGADVPPPTLILSQ